ncbi:MAG: hypothetical protein RLZZ196_1886 [Bacteroidota bacterium]|jgi:hypothetical protein
MKRDYASGKNNNAVFFIGNEVEHTPAFGMRTLFVTGIQPIQEIQDWLDDFASYEDTSKHIKHIFFGANHSFNPVYNDYAGWKQWDDMISHFLDNDYLCSLDIPLSAVEEFNDGGLNDYDNFIPQIRVPIPYIKLWNYNTMIKIDDKDFKATNPGVWTHSLHKLKDRSKFTAWADYKNDEIIK